MWKESSFVLLHEQTTHLKPANFPNVVTGAPQSGEHQSEIPVYFGLISMPQRYTNVWSSYKSITVFYLPLAGNIARADSKLPITIFGIQGGLGKARTK